MPESRSGKLNLSNSSRLTKNMDRFTRTGKRKLAESGAVVQMSLYKLRPCKKRKAWELMRRLLWCTDLEKKTCREWSSGAAVPLQASAVQKEKYLGEDSCGAQKWKRKLAGSGAVVQMSLYKLRLCKKRKAWELMRRLLWCTKVVRDRAGEEIL